MESFYEALLSFVAGNYRQVVSLNLGWLQFSNIVLFFAGSSGPSTTFSFVGGGSLKRNWMNFPITKPTSRLWPRGQRICFCALNS